MDACTKCNNEEIIGIQYGMIADDDTPCHYDGVSEFKCMNCGYREGRWSKRPLAPQEHEPPFGEKHRSNCSFHSSLTSYEQYKTEDQQDQGA